MDDLALSALPPETPPDVQPSAKRLSRQQQHRYGSGSYRSGSPSLSASGKVSPIQFATSTGATGTARAPQGLSVNTTAAAAHPNGNIGGTGLVILSPTPRRHLIESSASQHWLHTPPSEDYSPYSPYSPSPEYREAEEEARLGSISPLAQKHFPPASGSSSYPFPQAYSSNSNLMAQHLQQQQLHGQNRERRNSTSSNVVRRRRISSAASHNQPSALMQMQPRRFNELLEHDRDAPSPTGTVSGRRKGLVHISSSSSLRSLRGGSTRSMYTSHPAHQGHSQPTQEGHHGQVQAHPTSPARRYIRYIHRLFPSSSSSSSSAAQPSAPSSLQTSRSSKPSFLSSLPIHSLSPLLCILLPPLLTLFTLSLSSYSGHATPPMFGDYEAQRHWMEVTFHVKVREWYEYELGYWGLDYPPLTGWVSWVCGVVANLINPTWVALYTSRGHESPSSKLFMRLTVIALYFLVYIPALLMFSRTWQGSRSKRTQDVVVLVLAIQPALVLVDSGHFQYNCVMLGLTLLSMNSLAHSQDLLAAIFFTLSLSFKQMALYYAPAIGTYLLAKCIWLGPTHGTRLFIRLGPVTLLTTYIIFLPWLPPFSSLTTPVFEGRTKLGQVVHRMFPFGRGLWEDKVANFWCASNVVIKWKTLVGEGEKGTKMLVRMSLGMTVVGFLPGVVGMLRSGWVLKRWTWDGRDEARTSVLRSSEESTKDGQPKTLETSQEDTSPEHDPPPFLPLLPYALLTSSMSFFLFSFQVHEKTILLPLLPLTLLMSGAQEGSSMFWWGVLGNNAGVFSMYPLLKKDGLSVQYIAMLLLWNWMIGYNPLRLRPTSFVQVVSIIFYALALLIHTLDIFISPPARYPDLYAVLNVLVSTPVFGLLWMWSIKCGVEVGWAIGGIGGSRRTEKKDEGTAERIRKREENVSVDSTTNVNEGMDGVSSVVGTSTANEFVSYRQDRGRVGSLGYAQARQRGGGGILGSGGEE